MPATIPHSQSKFLISRGRIARSPVVGEPFLAHVPDVDVLLPAAEQLAEHHRDQSH